MPKCPECEENIKELIVFSEISQTCELQEDGELNIYGCDYCEGYNEFNCPKCNEKICGTEKEAIKFLKGETNGN